ncbi:hypothetical protein J6590_084016 [Homalodisca vitripennis]|nr:hypothetical protein J6590_084016 [Homalodisca vitripennis]
MVRTYIRKTQKGAGTAYSTEDLNKALEDIKNGIKTTRGAAMFYKISRSTLKHRIRGTRGTGMTSREEQVVESLKLEGKPEQIFNCDETSFCHDPSRTKVVGAIDTMLLETSATSVAMETDTCPASVEVKLKASKLVESAVMQQTTLSGTSRNQPEASSAMVQAEVGCICTISGRKSFEELLLDMVKKEKRPENTEKKRKRIVKNCEIITTNEYLIKKEIEEKEKEDKEKDKKEKVKSKTLGITNKVKIPKVATKRKKLDIFINKKKRNLDFETDSSDDMDLIDIVEENEKNVED